MSFGTLGTYCDVGHLGNYDSLKKLVPVIRFLKDHFRSRSNSSHWADDCQVQVFLEGDGTRLLHPWDFPGKSTGVGHRQLKNVLASSFPTPASALHSTQQPEGPG